MGLIDQSFFDDLVPKAQDSTSNAGKVSVTIRVDGDCFMMCDGDFVDAEFKANKITKVEIITGQHILEFQSVADPDNVVEKIVDYSENGKSYLLIVQGLGEKSKEEKQENAILEFKKQIQVRLEDDRRIDRREAAELEEIRKNLKIDIKTAHRLINEAREQLRNDAYGIFSREGSTFSVDVLKDAITKDDVDKIRTILPDVATYIESCDSESSEDTLIHYLYFMCMNALEPSTLIKMHESSYEDNYWRTFWTFLAYSRTKQRAKAADLLVYIQDIFLEYPADNINLLRAIDAYNNIGKDEALKCIGDVDGNFSTELVSLVEAIKYELGIDNPSSMEKEEQVAFIQDRVVSYEDHAVRIARKEQKNAELRRKITYTLTITGIKDQTLAMMTARTTLGWSSSSSRQKFAELPTTVLVTEDMAKAMSVYESLEKGKIIVECIGKNALGEIVPNCLRIKNVKNTTISDTQLTPTNLDYSCSGTTRDYTDNAKALKELVSELKKWNDECFCGSITEAGKGVIYKDSNTVVCQGIDNIDMDLSIGLCTGIEKCKILSVAITNSDYYCIVYYNEDINHCEWDGNVPNAMENKLSEFIMKGYRISSISIAENGDYSIISDKMFSSKSANNRVQKAISKAKDQYGTVLYADITNMGIVVCCKRGVYYENIPTKVEEKIKSKVDAGKKISFISFTDSGTCVLSDDKHKATWYM